MRGFAAGTRRRRALRTGWFGRAPQRPGILTLTTGDSRAKHFEAAKNESFYASTITTSKLRKVTRKSLRIR
jgi:hypothetical protein